MPTPCSPSLVPCAARVDAAAAAAAPLRRAAAAQALRACGLALAGVLTTAAVATPATVAPVIAAPAGATRSAVAPAAADGLLPSSDLPVGVRLSPEQHFHLALEAQTAGDYPAMLRGLRLAAAAGEVEAQEMLGMVLLVGGSLYGPTVTADRCEAARWLRRAAVQGSEVGRHHQLFLGRLRNAPSGRAACLD